MGPEHQKASQLRRIDRDEIGRLGADVLRGRHLLPAEKEDRVGQAERWLLAEDVAIDLVRAVTPPPRREQVLATLLIRDAEVVPLRAPLFVPEELGAPLERRDAAAVPAALRPVDVVTLADIGDRRAVVVGGERRADPSAVLADHRYRQPPRLVVDVRDPLMDGADLLGAAKHEVDLPIERARAIEVP